MLKEKNLKSVYFYILKNRDRKNIATEQVTLQAKQKENTEEQKRN